MPRRAADAAAAAPAPAPPAKKEFTRAALDAEAKALANRRKITREAAWYAHEKKIGSKAALKTGLFGDATVVTYNMVEPSLRQIKDTGKIADDRDHHSQILTNNERRKLAEWILACTDGHKLKDRSQVSSKIKEMLRARHKFNRSKNYGLGTIRLSDSEKACAESKEDLRHSFFQRFYPWCRAHGIEIEEGVDRAQDEKRAAKMTEATIERHFHGEFGLEAELLDAGIMDPETKVIKDPRRLLNSDETPQPIDMRSASTALSSSTSRRRRRRRRLRQRARARAR